MTVCETCRLQRPCWCDDGHPPAAVVRDVVPARRVRAAPQRGDGPVQVKSLAPATHPAATDHRSIVVRRHLATIAGAWPDMMIRLAREGTADRSGIRTAPASRPTIDPQVFDVVAEITEWAVFLAHVLMDETDWTPSQDTTTPSLLAAITARVGHFTEHPDRQLADAVADDARRLAGLAWRTARPSGRRRIPLHIPCMEHETTDLGERVPCPGQYTTTLAPDERLGDFVCTRDREHRLTPDEWQRSQRRSGRRNIARERDLDTLLHAARVKHTSERIDA